MPNQRIKPLDLDSVPSLRFDSRVSSVQVVGIRLARTSERVQVELNGRFSIELIEDIKVYCECASLLRVVLICLVTPIPALMVIILADCAPLAPPEAGLMRNYVYWIRLVITNSSQLAGVLEHFRSCLPALPMSNWQLFYVDGLNDEIEPHRESNEKGDAERKTYARNSACKCYEEQLEVRHYQTRKTATKVLNHTRDKMVTTGTSRIQYTKLPSVPSSGEANGTQPKRIMTRSAGIGADIHTSSTHSRPVRRQ